MKIITVLRNCLLVFFFSFLTNIISANATERDYCDLNITYDKAVSCDYVADGLSNFTSTIAFAKTQDGKVCAEVEAISIKDTGPITNFLQKSVTEQRGLLAFDIDDKTIENTLSSTKCPQLKLVNDFDTLKGYTKKITYSDKITPALDHVRCLISGNAGTTLNSSQCWLVDGKNFHRITNETFEEIVKSSNSARAAVKDINPSQILPNEEGRKELEMGQRSCDLIPQSVISFLKNTFFLIQVLGVILLVIITIIQFIKVITASDDEGLSKTFKNTVKRIIIVILLLLLPQLIIAILNIINNNAYKTDAFGSYIIGEDGRPLCVGDNSSSKSSSTQTSNSNYRYPNATYRIKVVQRVTSIEIDGPTQSLLKGTKATLYATVRPSAAANKQLTWTTSNPRIVSVTQNGRITAENVGVATITATATDGSCVTGTIKIEVTPSSTLKNKTLTLSTQRIGGGIEAEYGMQGFCIAENYIVMAVVINYKAIIYLVDKQNFHIYDSVSIGNNHANVLSYDPVDKVVFVGNTGQKPVMLKLRGNKLSKIKTTTNRAGQILYNEQNDLFMTANGTSIKVYTREQFYNKKAKPTKSFSMSGLGGYVPQGKTTYGNHVYYCISRNSRGKNAIRVYNIATGKLEQTIYDYTKSDTMAELEQAYFDNEGNMYTNYNHGNDIYKTNYNYYQQLK